MKGHLLVSVLPHSFSHEVSALCGAIVKNPAAEMFSEVGLRGMPECNPLRDCKKCFAAAAQFTDGEFFVYTIREAQEVLEESA